MLSTRTKTNLGRSAQRILKQKTSVLSWDVRAARAGQGDESGLVHTGKKWSIVPSPLVAWCGPDKNKNQCLFNRGFLKPFFD